MHSNVRRSWSGSGAGSMRASCVNAPHFEQSGRYNWIWLMMLGSWGRTAASLKGAPGARGFWGASAARRGIDRARFEVVTPGLTYRPTSGIWRLFKLLNVKIGHTFFQTRPLGSKQASTPGFASGVAAAGGRTRSSGRRARRCAGRCRRGSNGRFGRSNWPFRGAGTFPGVNAGKATSLGKLKDSGALLRPWTYGWQPAFTTRARNSEPFSVSRDETNRCVCA